MAVRLTYDMFTETERMMLRAMVQDRKEKQFAYVRKIADAMDTQALSETADELRRLDVLMAKLEERKG